MTEGTTTAAAESGDTLTRLEQEGEIAADYLEGLLDIADLDGDIDMDVEADRAAVSIVSDSASRDLNKLVGRDGEVLEALQELTRLAVHRETGDRSRLMLDIAGFRAKKREELAALGAQAAADVKASGEPMKLAPMTPFERKVVHDAVAAAGLRSESEARSRSASSLCFRPDRRRDVFGPVCVAGGADVCQPGLTSERRFTLKTWFFRTMRTEGRSP